MRGPASDRHADRNDTTRVRGRFDAKRWSKDGADYVIKTTIGAVRGDIYLRIRGTNTATLEPEMDPRGENPWTDLWFYSNPIFIEVK